MAWKAPIAYPIESRIAKASIVVRHRTNFITRFTARVSIPPRRIDGTVLGQRQREAHADRKDKENHFGIHDQTESVSIEVQYQTEGNAATGVNL